MVLPETLVWQMLDQLQSVQESKEATRTEAQDAQREHDLFRLGGMGACGSGRDLFHRGQVLGTRVQLS